MNLCSNGLRIVLCNAALRYQVKHLSMVSLHKEWTRTWRSFVEEDACMDLARIVVVVEPLQLLQAARSLWASIAPSPPPMLIRVVKCGISFGTDAVSTSWPVSVTRTSSSIRIPMPRYLSGAFSFRIGTGGI
uniref:Uncharacterized protein n=1 Tax=Arundo donax TaxID=35708 RepID=A0A0A9G853_ARUDO